MKSVGRLLGYPFFCLWLPFNPYLLWCPLTVPHRNRTYWIFVYALSFPSWWLSVHFWRHATISLLFQSSWSLNVPQFSGGHFPYCVAQTLLFGGSHTFSQILASLMFNFFLSIFFGTLLELHKKNGNSSFTAPFTPIWCHGHPDGSAAGKQGQSRVYAWRLPFVNNSQTTVSPCTSAEPLWGCLLPVV